MKTQQFKENHSKKISIWPFLLTGIQVPDTSIDQAHMQLSRSYVIAYADSSSNGIIWNIETSFNIEKFSVWKITKVTQIPIFSG